MIVEHDQASGDVPLPWLLARLTGIPWPAKRWIAERPQAWRYYTAVCRRAGWNGTLLGWHTPRNGPFAGIRMRALHPNHLWVPVGVYETRVGRVATALLSELGRRPDGPGSIEVWDVGAHRGLFSMLCARHGADRVLAFEPSASNASALREHLAANPSLADRIEIVHAAMTDHDGEVEFVVNENDGAVCQIRANGVDGYDHGGAASVQVVPASRLDSFRAGRSSAPSLVKIDVEGAEALVLRGAVRLLDIDRPIVLMEVHNAAAGLASIEQLIAAGYRCWRIDPGSHLAPLTGGLAFGHVLARPER